MRLKELQLLKYGPFEDQVLRFPGHAPGLHIIFGQNEAGKSSSLRALKALLFGIARNTRDDFIFGSDLLSVGAVIETDDGRECELQRWKKAPTLRDKDGKKLADASILTTCLNGMDETSFERFYGLDYEELQRGSKVLLEEKGNVGTSIFSAGLGALDIRKVLNELEEKAAALYTAKARTRSINTAIGEYGKLKAAIKAASLTGKTFLEKEEQVRKSERDLECLRLLQKETGARKTKFERIRRTRAIIAELNECEMQLNDLGTRVTLPPGFILERKQLSTRMGNLRDDIAERTRTLAELESRVSALSDAPAVLNHGTTIYDLQRNLELYRNARRDLPILEANAAKSEDEVQFILKCLPLKVARSEVESLRLSQDQMARIRALSSDERPLLANFQRLAAEADDLQLEYDHAKRTISEMPPVCDTERLAALVSTIQKEGDLEFKLLNERKNLERFRDETGIALKRLQFWNGSLEDLAKLKVPGEEVLSDFSMRMQRQEADRGELSTQIDGVRRTIRECLRENDELSAAGSHFFNAQHLRSARAHRDSVWTLVRRAWIRGENVERETLALDPVMPLHELFEKSIREADAVVDNRFENAARVIQYEDRLKRIESATVEQAKLEESKRTCELEMDRIRAEWKERWYALRVEAGSVAEMRKWIDSRNDLARRFQQLGEYEQHFATSSALIEQRTADLQCALAECTATPAPAAISLNGLLEHARLFCLKQTRLDQERKKLEARAEGVLTNWRNKIGARDRAKTALEQWKERWAGTVSLLHLRPDAMTQEAEITLAKTCELFDKIDRIPETKQRVAAMTAAISDFESQAARLVQAVDPALGKLHPDQAVEALIEQLTKARDAQVTLEQLVKQRDDTLRKLERAASDLDALNARLAECCVIAECGEPAELEAVERRFEEQQKLHESIDELKKSIRNAGDGRGLAELISEINDIPADELETQYALAMDEIANREIEIQTAYDVRARLQSELEAMDGKSSAAEAAAQAQLILAQIRDETEQYVRLRAAAEILKREIDRYRDENQTPLLKHASTIFAKLTCGGFSGVRADLDESGQNVLMGIRKNGHPLAVEGMSDGTRDQLYLAIRLAFLPLYLENEDNEPLPFVIDDVLINFDDIRCAAAFKYLYEMSARVQVIVFTHHKHIVDLAEDALPDAACRRETAGMLEVCSFGMNDGEE